MRRTHQSSPTALPGHNADQELGNTDEMIFQPMPNAPPTYEEAMTNSMQSIVTEQPPAYPQEANNNNSNQPVDETEQIAPYDSSGLPSYAEAHRLSQNSLDRL